MGQLSSAIKNVILVLLIVVIVHFLLKSMILDRKPRVSQQNQPSQPPMLLSPILSPAPAPTPTPAPSTQSFAADGNASQEEALKRFVFGGEEHNSTPPSSDASVPVAYGAPPPPQQQPATATQDPQATKDLLIIKQYDNESAMNGGEVFGGTGLACYDAYDCPFSAYTAD
jgi:hypothetical protein